MLAEHFTWVSDPTAWLGLGTLVVLEIVLGIDNLIFIAILADKLPPEKREAARKVGLSLALIMRLGLLAAVSWIVSLTEPIFTLFGHGISVRDLILILGGLFLLFKATAELHERLEGEHGHGGSKVANAVFWKVVVQILVLDLVFSLDSVITAVGMVQEVSVMMIAVIIAVGVMLLSSGPLMRFVSAHPTVVVLCLGFLLMIGFSLVADGFGAHIPKGYLYAAIGFSVLIEAFNQVARKNRLKIATKGDLRDRTAEAVLRMLSGAATPAAVAAAGQGHQAEALAALDHAAGRPPAALFGQGERGMIAGVLSLAERPVRTVMTPSTDVVWLDPDLPAETLRSRLLATHHQAYPVCRGGLDGLIGVGRGSDLLRDLIEGGRIDTDRLNTRPLLVHEDASVLRVVEQVRAEAVPIAVVTDEYGAIEGVVSLDDMVDVILGAMPSAEDAATAPRAEPDGSLLVDAAIDIRRLARESGIAFPEEAYEHATLGGYLFASAGSLPAAGAIVAAAGRDFEIVSTEGRRIREVRIRPAAS